MAVSSRSQDPVPPRHALAERLRALAEQARWLPPPSHRDPEAFHAARSDLAADLRRLAHAAEQAGEFGSGGQR